MSGGWPKTVGGVPRVSTESGDSVPDGRVEVSGPLAVNVAPTNYDVANVTGRYAGTNGQALTDDATNYLYLDTAGALVVNTVGYPSGVAHIRLARVVTESGFAKFLYDDRAILTGAGAGGGGGGGEANTASNLGAGAGIFAQKVGVDIQLKSLVAGSGVTLDEGAETITINSPGAGGDVSGPVSATDNAIPRFDGTGGKTLQNSLVAVSDAGDVAGVHSLDLNVRTAGGSGVPVALEGRLFYDGDSHALVAYNDAAAVTHQLGHEGLIRVYNQTGSPIGNGTPVYITGRDGVESRPTVAPARADNTVTARVIGLTTQTIANASYGYVTHWGFVNQLDTSAFSEGSPLYLSATVAGGLSSSPPAQGEYEVFLGYVVRADVANGRAFVTTHAEFTVGIGESSLLTLRCAKVTGGAISLGQVVYVSGYDGTSGLPTVELARADSSATMPAIGVALEGISAGNPGRVVISGIVGGLNTSTYVVGTSLYVSALSAGGFTDTAPLGSAQVQAIGRVVESDIASGQLVVSGAGRVNALPNLAQNSVWLGDGNGVPQATSRSGLDNAAVHVNTAGELNGITLKASPVGADVLLIEDSAAGFAKKRVTISTLPGGGGGEANTASNVGAGVGFFKQKNGVDLEFKTATTSSPLVVAASGLNEVNFSLGEINDAIHGTRAGGALHPAATTSVAGFMSSADKTKLDGVSTGATNTPLASTTPAATDAAAGTVGVGTTAARADHKHQVSVGTPVAVGTANSGGVASTLARSDHVHAHGNLAGGSLHAVATTSVAGFMSGTDKTKLDSFAGQGEYIRRTGTVPFTGSQSMGNFNLTGMRNATFNGIISNGATSGAVTINWSNGSRQSITLNGDATFSFTAPPGPCSLVLIITQDVSGGWSITWPGSVLWSKGNSPNLTVLGGSVDLVTLIYDGSAYYGGFLDDFS